MEIKELYEQFLKADGITTDTRNLKKGAMFFALKGANFNGNKFAKDAIAAGCICAVVDEVEYANTANVILVDDVLKTLQLLARHHRRQFDIPVLGITGSNGKTTTKELVGAVIEQKYNALITKGNLNNHLGVPFTLLELTAKHEIAIIEMGANKPGDIKELVDIAEPTHGIITNVGAAHIEGFGSLAGVIKTKTEMYDFIAANKGELFVNSDDEILVSKLPNGITVNTYGESKGDYQGNLLGQNPYVSFEWKTEGYTSPKLTTNLVGKYNFVNFLSAIAIGAKFGVNPESINAAIEGYLPSNNRSQVTKTKRNTLIVDCYNANATSMKAALDSFYEMEHPNKVVVLGDMLELGAISIAEHQKVVDSLNGKNVKAFLVGSEMQKATTIHPVYANWQTLIENEDLSKWKDQVVLLKGSRGIRLEELISHL